MKRTCAAMCSAVVAVAMSAALLAAQGHAGDGKSSNDHKNGAQANTVTFTGCLSPGSNAESFFLTNAKQKGVKSADKTLKVVAAKTDKKVGLAPFVTNEVEVTGTIDEAGGTPEPNPGSAQPRTITVTKVKVRGNYCG
jgi:hypothetical protein